MGWFFPSRRAAPLPPWDLQTPLLYLSPEDAWTIGAAMEGTAIFGGTGSGKTSAVGGAIGMSFLEHGFGGLVLTCKKDERARWEGYCQRAQRADDLLFFGDGALRWNFLDSEVSRAGVGAGHVEPLVSLFGAALEVAERTPSGQAGADSESFWRRTTNQCVRNALDLLLLAKTPVSVTALHQLIVDAPTSSQQLLSEGWRANSSCCRAIDAAKACVVDPERRRDLDLVVDYWLGQWPGLADRTRSVVVASITSVTEVLARGILRRLLCSDTNLPFDALLEGAVLLVDLPLKEYGDVGRIAQTLIKQGVQRFAERRDLSQNARPIFIWCDEAQNLATSGDPLFQSTARSSRVATVLITQNLPGFEAALGSRDQGKALTAALFSNLNTKLFCNNSDTQTNQYAADMIGQSLQDFVNHSHNYAPHDWTAVFGLTQRGQASCGMSEQYAQKVPHWAFSSLRTGGLQHRRLVDAIVYQNGRVFAATGENYLRATFSQL